MLADRQLGFSCSESFSLHPAGFALPERLQKATSTRANRGYR